MAAITYPSGSVLTYTPNAAGQMLSVVDSTDNAHPINYVTGAAYNAPGLLTASTYGQSSSFPGILNTFSYNSRLQPVNLWSSSPTRTLIDLIYDFHVGNGDNGNVYSITNNRDATRSQTFTFDPLNRLISAQNAGTDCSVKLPDGHTEYWGNNYIYDAWGNLNQKQVTKCWAENLNTAVNPLNRLQSYDYDAAGNMTKDNNGTNYVYDAENRISSTSGFSYVYDADGNRVQKINSNTTPATGTLYWYMSSGIVAESDLSGTLQSEYVFFNGERIARKDFPENAVSYYFSDHLKTASVISDATGSSIKSESDYYPWGGELQFVNGDSNHYKFSGKERDTETGLDYFGARYYSNGLGRFITPDWAAKAAAVPYADFADPQSLNLYTYVRNIPTSKADADGHDPLGDILDARIVISAPYAGHAVVDRLSSVGHFLTSAPPHPPIPGPSVNPCLCLPQPSQNNNNNKNQNNSQSSNTSAKADQLKANKTQGKAFEQSVKPELESKQTGVQEQLTVKTETGTKTRVDFAGKESGQTALTEAKSSAEAPLTPNQTKAFPEIEQTGATVVGKGKPGFPGGTKIPPTKVDVVRPND